MKHFNRFCDGRTHSKVIIKLSEKASSLSILPEVNGYQTVGRDAVKILSFLTPLPSGRGPGFKPQDQQKVFSMVFSIECVLVERYKAIGIKEKDGLKKFLLGPSLKVDFQLDQVIVLSNGCLEKKVGSVQTLMIE